jgi:proline dehydrogenase
MATGGSTGATTAEVVPRPNISRRAVGAVARRPWVRRTVVSTPFVRDVAWRFVAGETLDDALVTARRLTAAGTKATLSFAGTHVHDAAEAIAAAEMASATLVALADAGLEPNVSVKPTQVGLDIDEAFCLARLDAIVQTGRRVGGFVRVDMEEARYVESTLRLFETLLARHGREHVGIVIQSYLRGREADLDRMLDAGARIRLVKGGYWESADVVHRRAEDIDRAFLADIDRLAARGDHPAIATHDVRAVEHALAAADRAGRPRSDLEFQMLMGVRGDLSAALVRRGLAVRCYVPFGGQWYEYVLGCVRRIPGGVVSRIRRRAGRA